MNFACVSESEFSTTKNLVRKKKMSDETQKRKHFIDTHRFSVTVSPSGQCNLTAMKR